MKSCYCASLLFLTVCCVQSIAQDGEFDNLYLDGGPGGAPSIFFNDINTPYPGYMFYQFGHLYFGIGHEVGTKGVMTFRNSTPGNTIYADEIGVGIGTKPAATLHVYGENASSGFQNSCLLIEDGSEQTKTRTLLELVNNGSSKMVLENTDTEEAWTLMTNAVDNFVISRHGTGGAELQIRKDGTVSMGPGPISNFKLSPTGSLTINGTLNQRSDRNAKRGFKNIDADKILDKVADLPITSWQYKNDRRQVNHIGPMAQDFHATFGVGQDDKTISTVDASGVALAAIQALNKKVEQRDAQILQLQNRLAEIEAQIDK